MEAEAEAYVVRPLDFAVHQTGEQRANGSNATSAPATHPSSTTSIAHQPHREAGSNDVSNAPVQRRAKRGNVQEEVATSHALVVAQFRSERAQSRHLQRAATGMIRGS